MSIAIETLLRQDRWIVGGGLALVSALAWFWLLSGAGMDMSALAMTRMVYGDHSVMPPGMKMQPVWDITYGLLMFSMWWVMMVAMMLPSAAPTVLLAAMINRKAVSTVAPYGSTEQFVLGYLLVWGMFSLVATLAQYLLEASGWLSGMTLNFHSRWWGAGLLLAAACWQISPIKQACLKNCRSPVDFLVSRRHRNAIVLGLEHGTYCLGCCWLLMLLLFVGGVMNLLWIAGLSMVVLLEKLLPPRWHIPQLTSGVLLVLAGFWLVA